LGGGVRGGRRNRDSKTGKTNKTKEEKKTIPAGKHPRGRKGPSAIQKGTEKTINAGVGKKKIGRRRRFKRGINSWAERGGGLNHVRQACRGRKLSGEKPLRANVYRKKEKSSTGGGTGDLGD